MCVCVWIWIEKERRKKTTTSGHTSNVHGEKERESKRKKWKKKNEDFLLKNHSEAKAGGWTNKRERETFFLNAIYTTRRILEREEMRGGEKYMKTLLYFFYHLQ